MFRGSVKSTGYPLHSPVSPLLPLPRVTVCHHISAGLYQLGILYARSLKFLLSECNSACLSAEPIFNQVSNQDHR